MWFSDSHPPQTSEWERWYRTSPFPLYQIVASTLPEPRWVGTSLRVDGQTLRLGLAYGNPLRHEDLCFVQVYSSIPESAPDPVELIAGEHRDRHLRPVGSVETCVGEITVEERHQSAQFTRSCEVWVAESRLPGVTVTIVATRWDDPEGDWKLVRDDDVEPFIAGRNKLLGRT